MRRFWAFFAGIFFGGAILMWTAPLVVIAVAVAAVLGHTDLFSAFSGESVFGVREEAGRLQGRLINTSFQTIHVALAEGQPPRRLVVRLDMRDADVFDDAAVGQVRVDAWPLEAARDMMTPPLYTVKAPGRGAVLGEDGVLTITRDQRRSAFALADGRWLADADGPLLMTTGAGGALRLIAVARADDDDVPGAVATITYASPWKVMQRFVLRADDAARARGLKNGLEPARLVLASAPGQAQSLDIALGAGVVRIPLAADALHGGQAALPVGLDLAEIKPWR